jgi:hypothetical protein
MPSRRLPVAYAVRRPLTLWGKDRQIGEIISLDEVASLPRIDAMVRSGRLNPIFEEGDQYVERARSGVVVRVGDSSRHVNKKDPKTGKTTKVAVKKPVGESLPPLQPQGGNSNSQGTGRPSRKVDTLEVSIRG